MIPVGLLTACTNPDWTASERALIAHLSPIATPAPRPSNRVADDPAAVSLGARIFSDPGFSADGTVSCATCHEPDRHFTDGKAVAATERGTGRRNTPSIETAAWSTWFFWDGRADSAWAQAAGPLTNPIEHALTAELVRERVATDYNEDWQRIFGGVSEDPLRVLSEVGKALEAFERTLLPKESRFDRWAAEFVAGRDTETLTVEEKRGLRLFLADPGCVACHNGPLFTDHHFHNLGLPSSQGDDVDIGRALGVTQLLADPLTCLGVYSDTTTCDELHYLDPAFPDWPVAFKTPSLRNVASTGPYMHDGSVPTLEAVLDFYSELPGRPRLGHRELTLQPLDLSDADRTALIAFLGTLSSE